MSSHTQLAKGFGSGGYHPSLCQVVTAISLRHLALRLTSRTWNLLFMRNVRKFHVQFSCYSSPATDLAELAACVVVQRKFKPRQLAPLTKGHSR
jgi:hypothetical protein